MEITVDGQPMFISIAHILLLLIPGLLFVLYVVFYSAKLYSIPQKYIENKYPVKIVFRWRSFRIEGEVNDFQKFYIGMHYMILMFLITFIPVVLLGILTFYLSDFITLVPR